MTRRRWRREDPATAPSAGTPLHATDPPRPVDGHRIEADLVGRGYHVSRDEEGDLTGTWDGDRFWFLLLGDDHEVLQVRGRWRRTLPESRRSAALLAINDWNRERIWPKAYLREEEDGLALYSEVSVDLEHGATDAQLAQLVGCGLGTGVQLFAALSTMVPQDDGPLPPG
ncbi:YbjN domain-containing protein [Actinotalea sp. K2]|uniref:YbjN domain-containing protein n=1 Tax=Actinotalea sp. K2 TaxID=2939438 RepID=UPI002016F734|nr:YbjN domain-containing protein [Actinotalea sp. K2]MCL3860162.1 YbjN domain-containing protein [Actinotalea sp. K2]